MDEHELIIRLAKYLLETHLDELETDHHGDGPDCSYCRAIEEAGDLTGVEITI